MSVISHAGAYADVVENDSALIGPEAVDDTAKRAFGVFQALLFEKTVPDRLTDRSGEKAGTGGLKPVVRLPALVEDLVPEAARFLVAADRAQEICHQANQFRPVPMRLR